jgi:hypothetical protein
MVLVENQPTKSTYTGRFSTSSWREIVQHQDDSQDDFLPTEQPQRRAPPILRRGLLDVSFVVDDGERMKSAYDML